MSGDHYCKTFSAWQQFLTCFYAQITGKDSLREIERGLIANYYRLYHLEMTAVAKSALADAMNRRNPEMFWDICVIFSDFIRSEDTDAFSI